MATNTPNYNLIKPGGNDPVNIADINGNSDIIDTTLKNLNDRILPIATQAQAQAGTDNNTLTTPLRTLQSIMANSLAKNIRISSSTDINTVLEPGMYDISQSSTPSQNLPPGSYSYGSLLVFSSSFGGSKATTQIYASHGTNTKAIYFRVFYTAGTWTDWVRIDNVIPTKQQAINGTDNTMTMTPQRTKEVIDNSPITRYGTATGTNALIITANPLFDNLYTGLTVKFKNTIANTGNVTINVNSKGVKSVLNNDGTQIQSGKLKANAMYEITYDGTNFYLTKGGGESSPIKRVQRGSITIVGSSLTIDSTVLDFNVNKSVVIISSAANSNSISNTSTANNILVEIVDNTTLRFSRNATSTNDILVEWQLIEFENDVNVQTGTIDLTDTSVNVLISTIDTNKSILYFSLNSSEVGEYTQSTNGKINNSTTLSFRRGSSIGINKIRWFVVEIK